VRVCAACGTSTDEAGGFCPQCGVALPEHEEPIGDSLVGLLIDGQFRVEAPLGGGAFGSVYRGTQVTLDRPIALKIPTHAIAADPIMARRFAREARAAARVAHPGVVQIYAVGELADKRPYLAMQFVEGSSLDKILADGPVAPSRALRIARAIASALGETHAAGVVHRDLKPSNIMWRHDRNGDDRITLVDFGIAACKFGGTDATRLTQGGLIGTPHYMSPEQAHGDEVDARADLYALGCVLFELVTGTPPFDGVAVDVLLAHLGRRPPVPSELDPELPESIDRICSALLAKAPDDRPTGADEVVAMLDAAIGELEARGDVVSPRSAVHSATAKRKVTLATRHEPGDGTAQPRRTRWRLALTVALLLAAGGGFAAFRLIGRDDARAAGAATGGAGPEQPGVATRVAVDNDGETLMRVTLPDAMIAGRDVSIPMIIVNKLGQPVVASEIVVTVTDPAGTAKGMVAKPLDASAGQYALRTAFREHGHYVIAIFPPSGPDSAFEVPLDVQ
jgi:serine/threonine-protein kinase